MPTIYILAAIFLCLPGLFKISPVEVFFFVLGTDTLAEKLVIMKKNLLIVFVLIFSNIALAQNVGIGTNTPLARLHVADSGVLFTGPASLPATAGLPPVSGPGSRMMWYPRKAAFRAGLVTSTQWNESSVGQYSFAAGLSPRASGQYSTAFGSATSATGDGAFAWGSSTVASGAYATASGLSTSAPAYASTVIGRYNVIAGNTSQWVDTDPLFVVGNGYTQANDDGTATVIRRNALTLNKKGDMPLSGKGSFMGGLYATGGDVSLAQPTLVDPILYDDVYISGRLRYKVTVITVPATQNLTYTLNTNAYSGTVFDLRLLRYTANFNILDMKLTNGHYIGETIKIWGRDSDIPGNLPNAPAGQKWGVFRLSDNIAENNVNLRYGTHFIDRDGIIELMWTGNYWLEVYRNYNP